MLQPGTVFAGKYRIERALGEGGMGAVYVALNERLDKRVALKVLKPELGRDRQSAERFTREAVAASRVKHSGVVEIFDADVHEGMPWIAMELLEGESLRERLARGKLETIEAIDVVLEALDAIAAVHGAGIVHRDLKPDNVFLERLPNGARRVKVLDFGIAKVALPGAQSQTGTNASMGTPLYLAPEQARNAKDVDARADVYSMGVILYECLSGARPYDASTFGELVAAMFTSGPKPLASAMPGLPAELYAIVDRCVWVYPEGRPQSASELIGALSKVRGRLSGATPKTMAMDTESLARAVAPTAGVPQVLQGSLPMAAGAFGSAPQQPFGAAPMGGPPNQQPFGAAPSPQPFGPQSQLRPMPPPDFAARTMQPAHVRPSSGAGLWIAVIVGVLALLVVVPIAAGGVMWALLRPSPDPAPMPAPIVAAPIDLSVQSLGLPGSEAERMRVDVAGEPAIGGGEPLVTIVAFSDYQCPFCGRAKTTIDAVRARYGDDVRYVWRDNPLPFHQNAMPAAEAALEARRQGGDARFWQMHDLLFTNQQALEASDLDRYAAQIGLDVAALHGALGTHQHQSHVQQDQAAGQRVGARGTPTFFINGRALVGAQPQAEFQRVIDEEAVLAHELMRRGAPRSSLYEVFQRGARVDAPSEPAAPTPSRPSGRQPDPNAVYRVPIGGSPQRGPADALVTIVAFSEFQCPFCGRVRPTLEQLRVRYGNDLRIVFKHNPLPFHQNAMPAAELAVEAQTQRGDQTFWQLHDILFENQTSLDRESLERYARQVGLGPTGVARALDEHAHRERIALDQELARQIGATGTPSFFINGRNLRGAQPIESFERVIDEELVRARARVAAGTPRTMLYETIIANGATSPQYLGEEAPSEPDADRVYAIAIPPTAPTRGPAIAPVTIQQFSDFQCPFCSRVEPTITSLIADNPGRVRVVWRNYPLPFHPNAMPAAEAAAEVMEQGGSPAFWRYHDRLFENQGDLSRATLERLAGEMGGIDMGRFRRALDTHRHQAAIQADMDAVRSAGAQIGTPSFFINGRLLQGAQPLSAFQAAVDRAAR